MTEPAEPPPFATPRVAAGALFLDDTGRILMIRPTYKDYWDIPGGYAEPGESPRAACVREVREELGITPRIGRLLVLDWAPNDTEGDKVLFVFDGGVLGADQLGAIRLQPDEAAEYAFQSTAALAAVTIPRLIRRLVAATAARATGSTAELEHGAPAT